MRISSIVILLILTSSFAISQVDLSINPNKSSYRIGEALVLNFQTSSSLNSGAWVGLYSATTSHTGSKGYMTYKYINEAKDLTLNFDAPNETGEYEFRIFDAGPEKEVASIAFTVVDIDPRKIKVEIASEKITLGSSFRISIDSEIELNRTAWMGIYKSDAPSHTLKGYLSYKYVNSKKDNILEMKAPMEVGSYEIRLYSADAGKLLHRVPFHIGDLNLPGLQFSLDKEAYGPEEEMVIDYTGHEDLTNQSWLGLYPQDAVPREIKGYLDYRYLRPRTGGQVFFKAPSEKGQYEVRLFYSDSGPMLLEALPFSVSSSLDKGYLEKKIENEGKVILYGIYFDSDKAIVKQESMALIEQIAKMILSDTNLKILIEGHTDSDGDEAYNQILSEKRAQAISDLLISKYKVDPSQLKTIGYGESKPIGDNNSARGKAKNRRVELIKL